ALSGVGADRIPDSGYLRAKVAQETLIKASGVPYTILRATQFFEFLSAIAGPGAGMVRVSDAPMQPMAADDVAAALADVAVGSPAGGVLEVAGPESLSIAAFVGKALAANGDKRSVVAAPRPATTARGWMSRGSSQGEPTRASPRRDLKPGSTALRLGRRSGRFMAALSPRHQRETIP